MIKFIETTSDNKVWALSLAAAVICISITTSVVSVIRGPLPPLTALDRCLSSEAKMKTNTCRVIAERAAQ